MKKFLTAGCLMLFIPAMFSWPAFSEDTPDTPQLALQDREFDFGKIKEGSRITHEFIIQNKGSATLAINNVSPG
ncbi:MAG: DUF1573 domain-containing protein [Deltaproteobacteria bacterium]|nr:DUF1573 domain-containing protein [Deltaproteobacteria bacterium]